MNETKRESALTGLLADYEELSRKRYKEAGEKDLTDLTVAHQAVRAIKDLPAERIVLGACLLDEYPTEGLEVGDFSLPEHKACFIALQGDSDIVAVSRKIRTGNPGTMLAEMMVEAMPWIANQPIPPGGEKNVARRRAKNEALMLMRTQLLRKLGRKRRLLMAKVATEGDTT